jgi:IPT/TIG domain
VTSSFNPNSTTSSSTLTLTASSTASTGTVNVTVTGISGSLSNTTTLALTVQPTIVTTLPAAWTDVDIGLPGAAGSASYSNNVFTVNGAGTQIYGTSDTFNFVYQPLSGDGSITARVVSLQGGSGYVTAGVMIRETLTAGASNAKTADWGSYGKIYFDFRSTTAGSTSEPGSVTATLPYWVKVVRSGSTFGSYASADGVNWVQIATSQTISMAQNVDIGLAVNSGSSTLATATFDNVSVNSAAVPAPVISSTSATTGSIGSQVTITGTGFGSTQGNSAVLLNNMTATVNSWTATSINITIPTGATSGPLVVSVAPSMNDSNPVAFTVTSQPLPAGWLDQDVGSVGVSGSASFATGTFTVKGAGTQIYGTADSFHYVYQPLSGDGTIIARVVSVQGGSGYGTAGVMVRETLSNGSTNAKTAYWPVYGRIYFDLRSTTGGSTAEPGSTSATLPYWVKVVRSGSNFSSYASADGVTWVQVGTTQTITMAQNIYIGLVVNSGTNTNVASATFDNVSVTSP